MIRSELLKALAKDNASLTAHEIERIVDVFFEEIAQRLADDGRVELRGFGSFIIRQREARRGRNPRSGEAVAVPAKRVVFFKASRQLCDQLNTD